MKKNSIITFLLLVSTFVYSQNTIKGTFPGIANQQIKLVKFSGFDTYTINSAKADKKGVFNLSYSEKDYGMAYLLSEADKSFVVILDENENLKLSGENFELAESINVLNGMQNQLFGQYAFEYPRREKALSAWGYLEKIYANDSLFAVQQTPKLAIASEKQRIKTEDSLFLANLNTDSYISYYCRFAN